MKLLSSFYKRFLMLLFVLFLGAETAFAYYSFSAVCSTGQTLYYNITDATNHYVELTYPGSSSSYPWSGYTAPTGEITLPSSVTYEGVNYSVTSIGMQAFRDCKGLTGSLVIPNSVVSIGSNAFRGCSGFNGTLSIGSAVTLIGPYSFEGCSGFIGSLIIPNAVTSIENSAFQGCSALNGSLTIGESVESIGNQVFKNCGFTQVNYNAINCMDMSSVDKPFTDCGGTLVIGDNVQRIPDYMFSDCSGFTGSLIIPNSVTSIGKSAFASCSGFTGSLIVPNSVTIIDEAAFKNCSGFSGGLTIGDSVTIIGSLAFSGCGGFTGSLVIPNSVTRIGGSAFYRCSGFTGTLTIGNSVTTIGSRAFEECRGFTGSLVIPDSMISIGYAAFNNCNNIRGSLTIGNSVTTINDYAFINCGFHGTLTLGNSLNTIGLSAFFGASFTGPLTIPNSVISIGEQAFYGCRYFTGQLTIGSSVTTIDEGAFWYCIGFTSITALPETPPSLGPNAFHSMASIPLTVPCGLRETYQDDSAWSFFQNIYSLPLTVSITASPYEGGMVGGGGSFACEGGEICTVTAEPNEGYQFKHWLQNGTILSCSSSYSFAVSQDLVLTAVFMEEQQGEGHIIGGGDAVNEYLPSYSYYNHTLSQQIYTSEEVGGSCPIYSLSFFNSGEVKTRDYDIYMAHTTKTAFEGNSDWIGIASSDQVFSGSVTMERGDWTTIMLDTPFFYDDSYNLLLVVDDNTGSYSEGMTCRVFETEGYQSLFVYSDEIDYDPFSPWDYNGTRLPVKNQIILNGVDGLCSLVFDLRDSYGDGWNGNYLVVDFGNGVTQQLTVPGDASEATYTLPVWDGSHVALSWIENAWNSECSFVVSEAHGMPIYSKRSPDASFTYEFDMVCDEMPMSWAYVIGDGETTDNSLPTSSVYNYSLTEQIYTSDELGPAGIINAIAFVNEGAERTRTLDIYMMPTDKASFSSQTDWVGVTNSDRVFSGAVTIRSGRATAIVLDTPFEYDGSSNLLLVVDDNTGSWDITPVTCLVYATSGNQALQARNDETNYDPASYSGNGNLLTRKNCLLFDITRTNATQTLELSSGWNWVSFNVEVTMDDVKAAVRAANPGATPVIKSKGNGQTSFNGAIWVGALKTLDLSQMYEIKVANACTVTLEGIPVNPADHPATIKNGVNWIAYPLDETMSVATAFAGFPATGDNVKSKDGGQATWNGVMWLGALKNLVPGVGYLYISKASDDKTFTFPAGE